MLWYWKVVQKNLRASLRLLRHVINEISQSNKMYIYIYIHTHRPPTPTNTHTEKQQGPNRSRDITLQTKVCTVKALVFLVVMYGSESWTIKKAESVTLSVMSNSLWPMDWSRPGSYVHVILQARILGWVAIPFSRGSSWHRDQSQVSCIAGRFFTVWATSRLF